MISIEERLRSAETELEQARNRIADLEKQLAHCQLLATSELALKVSLERYQLLSDTIPDCLFVLDTDTPDGKFRIVDVNEAACRTLGYTREALKNMNLDAIDAPESKADRQAVVLRVRDGERVSFEQFHVRQDGTRLPVEIHAKAGVIQGKLTIVSLAHDISARKRTEENLRMFEAAIRQTDDGVIITDAPGREPPVILFVNSAFTQITGFKSEEALGKTIDLLHLRGTVPDSDPEIRRLHQVLEQGESYRGETNSFHRNGQPLVVQWSISPVRDDDRRIARFVMVLRDITAQKQQIRQLETLTEDLQTQRAQLTGVLDTMDDAVMSLSLTDRHLIYVSGAFERVFGYPVEIFLKDKTFFRKVVHPDDLELALTQMEKGYRDGYTEVDHRIILPDGRVRWLHRRAWVNFDETGKPIRVNDSAIDITARKLAEEAQRASEELYRSLVESSDASISLVDISGRFLYVNRIAGTRILQPSETLIGKSAHELLPPKRAEALLENVQRVLLDNKGMVSDAMDTIQGKQRWFHTSIQPVLNGEGKPYAALVYSTEITEQKLSEQAIRRQNEILRQAHDLVGLADPSGYMTYINQSGAIMLGARHPSELLGSKVDGFYVPEDAAKLPEYFAKALLTGHWHGENRLKTRDGAVINVEQTIFPIRDESGKATLYATIITDITERKKAENALRQSETYLRSLVDSQTAFSVRVNLDGYITYCNNQFQRLFDWVGPSLVGAKVLTIVFEDDQYLVAELMRQCMANIGVPIQAEGRIRNREGGYLWTLWELIVVQNTKGQVSEIQCVGFDISRQKQAEAELVALNNRLEQRVQERTLELERTLERLEAIFNHSGDGILLLDVGQGIEQTNHVLNAQFGLPAESYKGMSLQDLLDACEDNRIEESLQAVIEDHETRRLEVKARRADGTHFDTEISLAPVSRLDSAVTSVVCVVRDISERKQADNALRDSEARYRTLFTAMSEGILLFGVDGHVLASNAAAEEILGLTFAQIRREQPLDPGWQILHEDGSPYPLDPQTFDVFQFTEQPHSNMVAGVRKPDGKLTWILSNARPVIPHGEAQASGSVIAFIDITTRLETEQALQRKLDQEREVQRYFQALHAVSVELTQIDNLDDFFRAVVEMGLKHFGLDRLAIFKYDPAQNLAMGTYGTDVWGNVQAESHLKFVVDTQGLFWTAMSEPGRIYLAEHATLESEHQPVGTGWNAAVALWYGGRKLGWLTADNLIHQKPVSPIQLEILAQYGMYVAASLARRQAEAALQTTKDQLQAILDYSTAHIFMNDLDGKLILVNRHAASDVISTRQQYNERVRTAGVPMSYEDTAQEHTYWVTKFPIFDDQRRIYAIGGIATDITNRKLYEESLERALHHERELSELKSRFVSITSHEFRTPLATILATTETLLIYRRKLDEQQVNARLDKIRQQILHMKAMMEDVLQLTHFQTGRVEFSPVANDLDALCREIVDEFHSQANHSGRIAYQCGERPVLVDFDARLMRQIISNLISNALKYSSVDKKVYLDLSMTETAIALTVRDNGIGIPAGDLNHVFEAFHRGVNVGTISGTGLGLSIAMRAVEMHNGTLEVKSAESKGTTFVLRLARSAV